MLVFRHETPSLEQIREFFYQTDTEFDLPLSQKVDIEEYTFKLFQNAEFFVCYDEDRIVGMICCYLNRPPEAYISHVCVSADYQGRGIFNELFIHLKKCCTERFINKITLEVNHSNLKAQHIYQKLGFIVNSTTNHSSYMNLFIKNYE